MYGIVITEKGLELDAKLRAGNQLKLTRVMVGDGTVPEDTNPRKLTDLVSPFAEAASTAPVAVGASTMLVVEYRNDMNGGLDQDRYINEYGIWALDPNEGEILYLYGNLGEFREPVRAYKANDPVVTRRYPVSITVTDGVDVALGYLPTVFMTEAEARALIDAHNIDLTAHPDIRPITGEGAPTPETAGRLGQHYLDTNAGKEYVCIAADEETGVYTWKESGGGAAKNVSYDNEKSGLTASNVQDAIDEIAKGGGSGGSVLKITFAAAFAGHQYTVTDGDDTITGTVPKGLVASVSVINCDSTYTITTEVDSGDRYFTTVTTGPYYGRYTAVLDIASVTIVSTKGAPVTITLDGSVIETYTGTGTPTTVALERHGVYTITSAFGEYIESDTVAVDQANTNAHVDLRFTELATDIITQSGEWETPENIKGDVHVRAFGSGGDGGRANGGYYGWAGSGGGGGGHMETITFSATPGEKYKVTVGAGSGAPTSFGNMITANGGSAGGVGIQPLGRDFDSPSPVQGGKGGDGGSGGGAGNGACGYHSWLYLNRSNIGGDASYGGGGGAGGGCATGVTQSRGGNGGMYGGGGGASAYGSDIGDCSTGGQYGGGGGGKSQGGETVSAANGTNTTMMNLDFIGRGLAGLESTDPNGHGFGGGGGYGGNGGSCRSNCASGGGGGGYGADGGDTGISGYTEGGGGGGGYGGRGGDGCPLNHGGGGGGYGLNGAGGGPDNADGGYAAGGRGGGGKGGPGIIIVTYRKCIELEEA